jgi:prepilin-type N-terminal cleavage/methylation domain-containing protein
MGNRLRQTSEEDGFTLPEVLAAMLILLGGLLGVAMLSDVANRVAKEADGRAGATNIARRVTEAARSLTTTQLTPASLLEELKAAAPNLPDTTPDDAAWTVTQRGRVYVINASVCLMDDPIDGYAAASARDSSYCTQPAATNPADLQPDDYRRVYITVTNDKKSRESDRQVSNVSSGAASSLPLIIDLKMRQGGTSCSTTCLAISSQTQTTAVFDAKTANGPASVSWMVDGRTTASCPPTSAGCTGSGNAWAFTWQLGTPAKDTSNTSPNLGMCINGNYTLDGVYQVGLQAFDRNGATGGAASLSIPVNRCAALPPRGFEATGRNAGYTGPIDVSWEENSEGDLVGYRVYRGTSTGARTAVCPPVISGGQVLPIDKANECTDMSPPAYSSSPFYYGVYAVDRDTTGALREGAVAYYNVNTGNQAPSAPANTSFTAVKNSLGAVTLTWSMPTAQDPDNGDRIDSFRIYRRAGTTGGAATLANRYDHELKGAVCTGNTCKWVDPAPQALTQTYWVTSVDTNLRESVQTTGKTA